MSIAIESQEAHPVLWAFTTGMQQLAIASRMHDLLRFQTLVYQRYARKLSRRDADNMTISQAIAEKPVEEVEWRQAWLAYHEAWNTVGPECTQFECNDRFVMPLFDADPVVAAGEKSVTHAVTDLMASDPLSCYAKLLLDKCLEVHNNFVDMAQQHSARGTGQGPSHVIGQSVSGNDLLGGSREVMGERIPEPVALHLCQAKDMLTVDQEAFEEAAKVHATQSLRYAHGTDVAYDLEAIERWVFETTIHDAPVFQTLIPLFPFAGEGLDIAATSIGGVDQQELPLELTALIHDELGSLEACSRCQARLSECMDFLNILGGGGDTPLGVYCAETLGLEEHELLDFGGPAGSVRTLIRLQHLRALARSLKERLVDPLATLDPTYAEPLTEDLVAACEAAAQKMDLTILCTAMRQNLLNNFQGFLQPVPGDAQLGGDYIGWLDYQVTGEDDGSGGKRILVDYEWYDGNFPTDLQLGHLRAAYDLFGAIRIRNQVGISFLVF